MSSGFQCKQFYIAHDRCAMKVSTDALLLGGWAQLPAAGPFLDIGAGSGIISLMLTQRSGGVIPVDAVELDDEAATQARQNVAASPWPDVVRLIKGDILTYQPDKGYSLIVSNPPFFRHRLAANDVLRHQARHSDSLPFEALLDCAGRFLLPGGRFELILPSAEAAVFGTLAEQQGWYAARRCVVHTTPAKAASRLLMSWQREPAVCIHSQLIIQDKQGYTFEYKQLLREFYLAF